MKVYQKIWMATIQLSAKEALNEKNSGIVRRAYAMNFAYEWDKEVPNHIREKAKKELGSLFEEIFQLSWKFEVAEAAEMAMDEESTEEQRQKALVAFEAVWFKPVADAAREEVSQKFGPLIDAISEMAAKKRHPELWEGK